MNALVRSDEWTVITNWILLAGVVALLLISLLLARLPGAEPKAAPTRPAKTAATPQQAEMRLDPPFASAAHQEESDSASFPCDPPSRTREPSNSNPDWSAMPL
jgi:hypothetical protein